MPDNSWVDPQDFNVNSRLRASDAERDAAAAVINNALAEGRLSAEEHSQRLDAIFSAKTHADLVPVLDDLPAPRGVRQDIARPEPGDAVIRSKRGGRLVAILGGVTRKGVWHPEPEMSVLAVLGGLEVTVPPEMRVVDSGTAILGGREIAGNSAESSSPDAPVLRIEGTCVLGGVEVKRKPRKPPRELRRRRRANVSLEAGPVPIDRVEPGDNGD